MVQLPSLDINLPEWKPSNFATLDRETKKLQQLAQGVGKGSDAFNEACEAFRRLFVVGRYARIPERIRKPVDVRALTHLMLRSEDFARFQLDSELLEKLTVPRDPISRLSLLQLVELFFKRFDELASGKDFELLCEFMTEQLNHYAEGESDLRRMGEHAALLFARSGPAEVVLRAKNLKQDLDVCFRKLGIDGFGDGRFQDICRFTYYLETLKQIPVGAGDPVLSEVCKREVYLAPGADGKLLGHEVLTVLIDRSDPSGISDAWQAVLLTIAGDPRVPTSHPRYQQWWALLGESRVAKVKGWLSRFDLNLFLRVLESYGEESGNAELKRMFPSRKRFLEGLLEQKLVSVSRLFLSRHADSYIRKNYDSNEIPEYATVSDPTISMIYLQVGDLHIVEGTHSFKIWIYPALARSANLLNYGVKHFARNQLSQGLNKRYIVEYGGESRAADITHSPHNCNWQYKAIQYLQSYGLKLDIEKLFSKEDYRLYKKLYGISGYSGSIKSIPVALGVSMEPEEPANPPCWAADISSRSANERTRDRIYNGLSLDENRADTKKVEEVSTSGSAFVFDGKKQTSRSGVTKKGRAVSVYNEKPNEKESINRQPNTVRENELAGLSADLNSLQRVVRSLKMRKALSIQEVIVRSSLRPDVVKDILLGGEGSLFEYGNGKWFLLEEAAKDFESEPSSFGNPINKEPVRSRRPRTAKRSLWSGVSADSIMLQRVVKVLKEHKALRTQELIAHSSLSEKVVNDILHGEEGGRFGFRNGKWYLLDGPKVSEERPASPRRDVQGRNADARRTQTVKQETEVLVDAQPRSTSLTQVQKKLAEDPSALQIKSLLKKEPGLTVEQIYQRTSLSHIRVSSLLIKGSGNMFQCIKGLWYVKCRVPPQAENPSSDIKICKRCEEVKPLREFHKSKKNADGHTKWCKECLDSVAR